MDYLEKVRRLKLKWAEEAACDITGESEKSELSEKSPPDQANLLSPLEAQARLLERLRAGHLHLIDAHRRLVAEQSLYDGMADELTKGLDTFEALEKLLRGAYPEFAGCVMGAGRHCPTASPVWCQECTRKRVESGYREQR